MHLFGERLKGSLITDRITSTLLADNPLGDPHERHLPVYLPPGYHQRTQEFPLLIALSGLFGSSAGWLSFRSFDENMIEIADRLISERRIPPMVIAFPDCSTRFGGSQYLNSAATGPYMDHITQEILPYLSGHYCVTKDPARRAIAGKSSGGFGALRMVMTHPELFGHCLSSAGDLHFGVTLMPELAKWPSTINRLEGIVTFMQRIPQLRKLGSDEVAALGTIALASCYSPNPESPQGFDLPLDARSGELDSAIFERWLLQDPVVRVDQNKKEAKALAGLKTLYVEAGDRDEYHADLGARVFASRCQKQGVSLKHVEYKGGHFGATWRWEVMFEELSAGLSG